MDLKALLSVVYISPWFIFNFREVTCSFQNKLGLSCINEVLKIKRNLIFSQSELSI